MGPIFTQPIFTQLIFTRPIFIQPIFTQPIFIQPISLGPLLLGPFSLSPFTLGPLLGAFKPEDSREVRESRSLGVWPLLKGIEQFETLNHKCRTGWTGWDS